MDEPTDGPMRDGWARRTDVMPFEVVCNVTDGFFFSIGIRLVEGGIIYFEVQGYHQLQVVP